MLFLSVCVRLPAWLSFFLSPHHLNISPAGASGAGSCFGEPSTCLLGEAGAPWLLKSLYASEDSVALHWGRSGSSE